MENLNRYFDEIKEKEKKLNKQEECILIVKAQSGCTNSRDIVIASNLRFVVQCAKERQMGELYLEELIQVGSIGLIKAIESFDISKNFKFISYAVAFIRNEINTYLTNHYRTIRLPANICANIYRGKADKEDYASAFSIHKADESDLSGYSDSMDIVPSQERKDAINAILDILKPHQKQVIEMRLGLIDGEKKTYMEIGEQLGITHQAAMERFKNAMARIRRKYTKEQLIKILF